MIQLFVVFGVAMVVVRVANQISKWNSAKEFAIASDKCIAEARLVENILQ